jgi:OPA family glycerol-3-phosphate transporter-like MFS transporter
MLFRSIPFQKRRLSVMVVCWLAYVVIYLLRSNLAVALPYIESSYGINKASLGLLGSVFMWVYGIGHLVNGNIGDRSSSKLFIFIGIFMAALCNLIFGLTNQFWVMVFCWAVNGWFSAMLWGPIVKTIAKWYPQEKSGSVVVAVSTSMTVGTLLSLLLSRNLAGNDTWRWIFFVPACIGGVFLLVHLAVFRDTPSFSEFLQPVAESAIPSTFRKVKMRDILLKTRIRYIVIAALSQGIVKDGISLWATIFFVENYGLNIKTAILTVLMIPVMNFLGVLAVGWLHRKYPSRIERLTACTFGIGVLLMALLLVFNKQSMYITIALLAFASAAMYAANTLLLGIIPISYTYCGRVSAVAGFLDFCAYMASGFAAIFSGILIDKIGWIGVMVLWLAVTGVGMTSLIMAERSHVTFELLEDEGEVLA